MRGVVFRCIQFLIKCREAPQIRLIHRRCVTNVKQRWDAAESDPRKWDSAARGSFGEAGRIRSSTCTHSHLLYLPDIWVYSWLTALTVLHPQLPPPPPPPPFLPLLNPFFLLPIFTLSSSTGTFPSAVCDHPPNVCCQCWCALSLWVKCAGWRLIICPQ